MDTHRNAPLTPKGREAMVRMVTEGGLTKAGAARQFNTSAKTVAKWHARFREHGAKARAIVPPGRIHRQAKPLRPRVR